MRIRTVWKAVSGLTAVAAVGLVLAGVTHAQARDRTTLKLLPVANAAIGEEMVLTATLTDQAGAAVAGAEIVFHRDAVFLNSTSEPEIGRAVTDGRGTATTRYVPRSEGEVLILADFSGNPQYGPSSGSLVLQVATGGPLYAERQGVRVPGINVSFLVAILGGVWATYFAVMVHIFLIARGDRPAHQPGASRD